MFVSRGVYKIFGVGGWLVCLLTIHFLLIYCDVWWTRLCVSRKPWVTSRWNCKGFFFHCMVSLNVTRKVSVAKRNRVPPLRKVCLTPPSILIRLLPKSYFIKSQWVLVLFFSFSFFFPSSTPLCLSCPFSFIRPCPRLLIYVLEEQLSRAGREVGQAGCLQALQGSKHWAHCLKHTLALAHTRMHAQSSSPARKPPGHVHLHPF